MASAKPDLETVRQTAAEAVAAASNKPGAVIAIDTHGYSLTDVVPAPNPEPEPEACCGNCPNWQPKHMLKSFGDCALSRAVGQAPIVTTDFACCSSHPWLAAQ